MRRRILRPLLFGSFALASVALAASPAKANSPPKPAPLLVEAFKGMVGSWACQGKFKKGDGTGETDSESTMVISAQLDGFTYSGTYQVPKSELMPNGMQGQILWSYDSANRKLLEFFVDSYGGTGRGTSDGLQGDTLVWNEDQVLMGQAKKVRTTLRRSSPSEFELTFDAEGNGTWVNMGRNVCKKKK